MLSVKGVYHMDQEKDKKKHIPPYATFALADPETRDPETKPSEDAVAEAKDWVDHKIM